jgi:hypothetical protein
MKSYIALVCNSIMVHKNVIAVKFFKIIVLQFQKFLYWFPSPDDPEDIVELAKTMVGNIYYNEMWNSCKKLAIYCRYDLVSSLQIITNNTLFFRYNYSSISYKLHTILYWTSKTFRGKVFATLRTNVKWLDR